MAMNASCSAPVHVARTLTEPPIWPKLGAGGIVPTAAADAAAEAAADGDAATDAGAEAAAEADAAGGADAVAPPALGDAPPPLHAATRIAETTRAANRVYRGVAGCMELLSG
jgi:hypothetical protein